MRPAIWRAIFRIRRRDGMVREVVQRTLELAIGGLADELVATRRARNIARDVAHSTGASSEVGRPSCLRSRAASLANAFHRSEAAWDAAVAKLDAWIARKERP